jgi:hypothetical protein
MSNDNTGVPFGSTGSISGSGLTGYAQIGSISQTAQGLRIGVPAQPQGEVDRALEVLDSDLQSLFQELTTLQSRLVCVLSMRPQAAENPPQALTSGYSCALASSLEQKTDVVKGMRQLVNGVLADLQL